MNTSKLDIIVLGALALLALALVGAYALVHPNLPIPSELNTLAGTIIGVLGGRVMPALTATSSSSSTPPALGGAAVVATPDDTEPTFPTLTVPAVQ